MVDMHAVRCLNAYGNAVETRYYPGETYAEAEAMVVEAGYTLATNEGTCIGMIFSKRCTWVVKTPGRCPDCQREHEELEAMMAECGEEIE